MEQIEDILEEEATLVIVYQSLTSVLSQIEEVSWNANSSCRNQIEVIAEKLLEFDFRCGRAELSIEVDDSRNSSPQY